MKEKDSKFRKIADEMRSRGKILNIDGLFEEAIKLQIEITIDDVLKIKNQGLHFTPKFITDFIISYLKDTKIKHILDPFAGFGSIITPIVQTLNPLNSTGIVLNKNKYELAKYIEKNSKINFILANPILELEKHTECHDVIASHIPFGIYSHLFTKDNSLNTRKRNLNYILLAKSAQLLSENGLGFYIVSSNTFFDKNKTDFLKIISNQNLGIEAVLFIPEGSFYPSTSVGGYLVIVRKGIYFKNLFVGELSKETSSNQVLLKNLKQRSEGKSPKFGNLISIDDFNSFQNHLRLREINELGKQLKLKPIPLSEVAFEINLAKKSLQKGFENKPNSVYLPLIGNQSAVTSLDDLSLKSQNYAQIVIDPKRALASQVALLFNCKLGYLIRNSLQSGITIPKISKTQLVKAKIYIFDSKITNEFSKINKKLTDLFSQLSQYLEQIYYNPYNANKIEQKLKLLGTEEDIEYWIESLPFPLASILWRYQADSEADHKIDHLLQFFEALTQFNTILMISALASEKDFYEMESNNWLIKDPSFRDWYNKPTFGNWRILSSRLAKTIRGYLSSEVARDFCLKLFGSCEKEFIEILTNKRLQSEFEVVNNYRNTWKGHGGITSTKENQKRLLLLEESLSKVRQLMTNQYSSSVILRPISSEYDDGIYDYKVKRIMGTNSIFKEERVKTFYPLDKKYLYFLHKDKKYPVKILPFIRLMKSPEYEQNACYYYNRIEKNEVRWISYHFEHESEIIDKDLELLSALDYLKTNIEEIEF